MGNHARGDRVDVILPILDRGVVLTHTVGHFVPEDHRVPQRVGFGCARQQPAWPLHGQLEAVTEDPLDAVTRKQARLLSDFLGRSHVHAAPEAGVLALAVLAHADHVDIRGSTVRQRRGEPGQEPHRAEIDVLLESLAQRQQEVPHGDVIGDGRRADGPEVDRIEGGHSFEPIRVHHPSMAGVVIAAPRQHREAERHARSARRGFNRGDAGRDDFLADSVSRNDGDRVCVCVGHVVLWRSRAAGKPGSPSA